MAERHWGNYNPTDDMLADAANGQDPFGVGGSQYKPGYENLPSQVNINQGAPPTALRIDPTSILRLPKTEARKGVRDVIKSSFDFSKVPAIDLTTEGLLDASDTEGTLKRTATDGVQSGQTSTDTAATTIDNLNAMRMAPPTVDPEQTADAYGMINTPMPTMQDTTIDQWNPAYRNFAIGSAIGNLFNGRGLDGAIQQFGAFADTQQNQAQLAYQKQVAEATQRRQTGLDKLKIIQDIYGTDRQVFNDQNDSIDRQIKIVQDAENRRLDNEAKMDRVMYQAESSMDRVLVKGEIDAAQGKVTAESKLRTELFKIVTTGNREHYINAAKLLNELTPGLNLPTDKDREWTQKELDLMSKIIYRDKILGPTIEGIQAGTRLKDEQAKQASARTKLLEEQFKWYGKDKASEIAKRQAEIENMAADNTLNREKFNENKSQIKELMRQGYEAQKLTYTNAQKEVDRLQQELLAYEKDYRSWAKPTPEDIKELARRKEALAAAKTAVTDADRVLKDMIKQREDLIKELNKLEPTDPVVAPAKPPAGSLNFSGSDFNQNFGGDIDGGVARNRP